MTNVLLTVDTEVWCDGWHDLDAKFPDFFRKYVYGPTRAGDYGLPILFKVLADFGLRATFFVEPLFALRFGLEPLREIVGLVRDAGQEVQLHAHPEWLDESREAPLFEIRAKQPRLSGYSLEQQRQIIAKAKELLVAAGAQSVEGFRAGSYAADRNTLLALADNGIFIDSSYNWAAQVGVCDMFPGLRLLQPAIDAGVTELPVSVYQPGGARLSRHLQLTACSFAEMRWMLEYAQRMGWDSVVIVLHNFELLTEDKLRPNRIVFRRFVELCRYLADHADRFATVGIGGLVPQTLEFQPEFPKTPAWLTAGRYLAQAAGRYQ